MGINNLCKLLDPIAPPTSEPQPFDSILIDCQSYLYIAIEHSLETREAKLFLEICESIWSQLSSLLQSLLNSPCISENPVVVLSFDGEGVPMKWATQKERRRGSSSGTISKKSFYRYTLFGHNKLTVYVQDYLLEHLKAFDHTFTIVLTGCNVPGEGEHKIFHLAESPDSRCRNPVIVSVDQDVFILALLRLDRYDSIQVFRYNRFYHVTQLAALLPYPVQRFLDLSILFGNDFVSSLVAITPSNVAALHAALTVTDEESVPAAMAAFLQRLQGRLRYDRGVKVDRLLVVCFWMTYFWILDYYTRRLFPQLFLENRVHGPGNRDQLLTALTNRELSESAYSEAQETYQDMLTQPIPHAEQHIFTDQALLNDLKKYWIEPTNSLCYVVKMTSSDRT